MAGLWIMEVVMLKAEENDDGKLMSRIPNA